VPRRSPSTRSKTSRTSNASSIPRYTHPSKPRNRSITSDILSKPSVQLPSISSIAELDYSIPPINVLLVDDNILTAKLMKKQLETLQVKCETAINGQVAIEKWLSGPSDEIGGERYHLILMDHQMPVMGGLEATREIRRLEKEAGIVVDSSSTSANASASITDLSMMNCSRGGAHPENGENNKDQSMNAFKGPYRSSVIIVALTASSAPDADRHAAMLAGCNDFLTKPLNMGWLEKKLREWGSMQMLVNWPDWRGWKGYV
jgi:osomolarity two-component system, response regulator SSK1